MKIGNMDSMTFAARIAHAKAIAAKAQRSKDIKAMWREVNNRSVILDRTAQTGDALGFILHRAMLNGTADNLC
jgi:hypothetical protein